MRGYIRKRGQGYQVEIYLGLDENGRKLRHLKTMSNRKAAEKYLRDKLTEFEGHGAIRAQSNE
ncbi:MAG: site-specific integrase, partial [Armatimonadetes bacterium]|nr:site-specific integrase [Armatimonadota bacterium]